jgi:hypothetical protein
VQRIDGTGRAFGADAMRIRGLFFACLYFSTAIIAGNPPAGPGLFWCTDEDNRRGRLIAEAIKTRVTY